MATRQELPIDDNKFRELILFIAERSEGDKSFGATKLNKLLFFADFLAYRVLGKSITGQTYQKLENGPAPRRLVPVIKAMEADGSATQGKRRYYGRNQTVTFALREPDLSEFSAREIALVTSILAEYWGKTASEMSAASHEFLGWKAAELHGDIPYETVLVSKRRPTYDERRYGQSLEDLAKECLARDA